MVNISYIDFEIEEVTSLNDREWYTYASCVIQERKKKWGLIPYKVTYSLESLLLLVCSENIQQSFIEHVVTGSFEKRLSLSEFNSANIEKFFAQKVNEAAECNSTEEAFDYLSRWFVIDE